MEKQKAFCYIVTDYRLIDKSYTQLLINVYCRCTSYWL